MSEQHSFPTGSATTGSRFGPLRAGILVVLTILLPGVALLGPNQLYEWLSPAEDQQVPQVAQIIEPSSTTAQMQYGAEPHAAAANVMPQLSEPKYMAGSKLDPASSPKSTQLAFHAQAVDDRPVEAQPVAEYRFRESASGSHDRMQQIQQRLQLLGARYMVLETWGDVAPSYRFYCRMPGLQGGHSEHESVCGDPVEAMQRVLSEVEQVTARR